LGVLRAVLGVSKAILEVRKALVSVVQVFSIVLGYIRGSLVGI